MTFNYLRAHNTVISRTKRDFEVKEKTFFFASQVLSFRHTKQTSKNVVDATFTGWYRSKSQNGCFQKTKHARFSEKRTFLTPWYAHIHCSFFGKFGVLCFVETLVLRFALLPYYRRIWAKNPTSNILEIIRKPMVF